ncbi:MAG: CHAD domain-containing protein [Rhizomicrobium sp.]
MDEPEDDLRGRRGHGIAPAQSVATIIAVEPGLPPAKRSRPLKAKPAFLPREATAEEAFRLTLTQCKWHVAANVPAVVDVRDVEGMHQLRVGFRRLRVALSSFGGEFRTPAIEALRARAKKIAARLGSARDLDVFLGGLFEPVATANGSAEAFAVLRARAESARRRAWDDAVSCIISPVFSSFMADLGEALDRQIWREGTPGGSHATKGIIAFEAPATSLAVRMLDHRLAQARKRGRHLERLSDTQRHQLRIALKKLRYSAEFFAPLYEPAAVALFVNRLSGMQDVLGALNDVVVARKTLEWLVDIDDGTPDVSHAALSFAAGMVYGWHLQCAAHTWENAVKRWKKFTKAEPFWSADTLD